MKLFVGITDPEWVRYLRERRADEMNFWRPRSKGHFKVLEPGELFLFKSKYPDNRIVGGAFFVRHTVLSLDLAWKAFGQAKETLENPRHPRENTGVSASADWVHGQQAARFR